MAVILVVDVTVIEDVADPNLTVDVAVKPVPATTTNVPPVMGPLEEETDVTVGATRYEK